MRTRKLKMWIDQLEEREKIVWGRGVKSCEEGFGRRRVRSERKRGLGESGVEW